ncbi:MAG: KH domain-containing protein [Candidatus Margulisbacteria bacterium]|nr:KH domain-containing protein [Candidatus Margulisiibacteriota bacterium]
MSERRGFFGFLKGLCKSAQVESKSLDTKPVREAEESAVLTIDIDPAIEPYCMEKLQEIMELCGYDVQVKLYRQSGDKIFIDLAATEDLGRLIGRDGFHLEAIQTLMRAFVFKQFNQSFKIILDAGGYRRRRRNSLRSKVMEAAKKVVDSGESITLDPMNSAERRMVHVLFEGNKEIDSLSSGDGAKRHVILAKKS